MLHKYSEQQLREMGVADFHIQEMKRELWWGNTEHLHVFNNIGSWKWIRQDIFKLLENNDRIKPHEQGLCNHNYTEYTMYFDIHPLERENFKEKILPEIYKICEKNGSKAIWIE